MGPDTLQECYRRYQRELYLYLRALCASAPLAEDLLQETFLRALLALPEAHTNIRAWLYRVARNLALMALRQRERQADLSEEEWDAIPAEGPALSPEERELLQTALAALEEQERRIVVLHAVTGLKHREIAQLLELPLATVLSKYHRALKKLKVRLEGDDAR